MGVVNAGRGSLIVMPDLIAALVPAISPRRIDVRLALPADDPAWRHRRSPSRRVAGRVHPARARAGRGRLSARRADPEPVPANAGIEARRHFRGDACVALTDAMAAELVKPPGRATHASPHNGLS
jgi:hypothetical protein